MAAPTIRARLTAYYAAALTGTMVLFGGTLWVARGAAGYRELQRYVTEEAEVAVRLLQQVGGRTLDGRPVPLTAVADPIVGPQLVKQAGAMLDALPNVVIVTDSSGRVVWRSQDARLLVVGELDRLTQTAAQLTPTLAARVEVQRDTAGRVGEYVRALGLPQREELLLVRTAVGSDLTPLRTVIVGTPSSNVTRAQRELLGAALALAPLVLVLSVGAAWLLARGAVRPIGRVINEVEAITDGRSLHRRVAMEGAGDELARLANTLNAMIGRLETSFGALRRFTADASHELKTPLTVIRANVERAMSAAPGAPEQMEALEEALQEVARMASLVESLLTLARFDEGRFDLHREPVGVEPLVRDVHETAVILGESAGLTIELVACEPVTLLGDPMRLRQLFLNLVTNAIKYTPRGGRVEIALRRTDEVAVFSVRDTGIGIAAADLPYVFDRFWRADRVRSRRVASTVASAVAAGEPATVAAPEAGASTVAGAHTTATLGTATSGALLTPPPGTGPPGSGPPERGGFGLGLAISQWIAQAHGGTIAVTSRLTRGTTFTVTVPLPTDAEVAEALADG